MVADVSVRDVSLSEVLVGSSGELEVVSALKIAVSCSDWTSFRLSLDVVVPT